MATFTDTPAGGLAAARSTQLPRAIAAALSLVAATVHLVVSVEHVELSVVYGALFVAAAAGQGLLAALLLLRPAPLVVAAGLWGNVVLVALYLASRAPGSQLALHAGHAQVVGDLDLICIAAEVATVVLLPSLLGEPLRRRTLNGLLAVGLSLWAFNAAGLLG